MADVSVLDSQAVGRIIQSWARVSHSGVLSLF